MSVREKRKQISSSYPEGDTNFTSANEDEMMFAFSVRKIMLNVSECMQILCLIFFLCTCIVRGHVRLIHCSLAERDIFRLASFERVRIKFS